LSKKVTSNRIVLTFEKVCATPSTLFHVLKKFPPRVGTTKSRRNGLRKMGRRRGVVSSLQEGQDLCACAAAEELIFNTSSEHQTVDLSNKCMTKDFLRDFRHGCTVHGGQEDRTFDMQVQVDT
jgi:hypothetical protein